MGLAVISLSQQLDYRICLNGTVVQRRFAPNPQGWGLKVLRAPRKESEFPGSNTKSTHD